MKKRIIQTEFGEFDTSKLQQLGRGYENRVYAINDEMVLKVSTGLKVIRHFNHGLILEELEGLPFIPKVFDYSDDGSWSIQQRIQGTTIYFYSTGRSWFNVQFDCEEHRKKIMRFLNGCADRGWEPGDLRNENIMLDIDGSFWVVDVGGFRKTNNTNIFQEHKEQLANYGEVIVENYESVQTRLDELGPESLLEKWRVLNEDREKLYYRGTRN